MAENPTPPTDQPKPTEEELRAQQAALKRAQKLKGKHLEGCPANLDRIEQYDTDRVNRDHTATAFVVTRCQDCGGHEAKPK